MPAAHAAPMPDRPAMPTIQRLDIRDAPADPGSDPFGEHVAARYSLRKRILGGLFSFESDSRALLDLVEAAYGGLPQHALDVALPVCRVELRLSPRRPGPLPAEPPTVKTRSGAGWLCGVMDAGNYVMMAPRQGQALVVAAEDMLERAYYLRYELIEFAVFVLAARAWGLVPLHAACIGRHGRGALLLGASGAGKSTLALHSLLRGLDFVAEDAVFVQPERLLATGVPNYLHVRADALRFIEDGPARQWIVQAPVIRRRSGVEKLEPDLRLGPVRLAPSPLQVAATVFVSSQPAPAGEPLLLPIAAGEIAARLAADQPYAAGQAHWDDFAARIVRQGAWLLRRGRHPEEAVDALLPLLA